MFRDNDIYRCSYIAPQIYRKTSNIRRTLVGNGIIYAQPDTDLENVHKTSVLSSSLNSPNFNIDKKYYVNPITCARHARGNHAINLQITWMYYLINNCSCSKTNGDTAMNI